jgi:outer membrane beta-barrel protein
MHGPRHQLITTFALALGLTPCSIALAQEETKPDSAEVTTEAKETELDEQEEGEEKKKLSDRIKSVQRKSFLKEHRFEIFPFFALDLNDPFFQHMIVGLSVGFHLVDSLALEARGGKVFASLEQDAIKFVRTETDSLLENPPEFDWHADLDLTWAPFYGKISILGEGIMHFDTYITAGGGVFATDAGPNPAGNVGLGVRYFMTDWLIARVEIRDYIFVDTRNDSSDVQNLLILGFSVAGFFPTSFEYEFE